MKSLRLYCLYVLAVAAVLLMLEVLSVERYMVLEPATVRRVVPDVRGFIGADKMTIVRFADGFDDEIAGDRGEAGDKIMAYRQRGTVTIFGVLGDVSIFRHE